MMKAEWSINVSGEQVYAVSTGGQRIALVECAAWGGLGERRWIRCRPGGGTVHYRSAASAAKKQR